MLTAKQERFCLEYVIDYNATQAAIRANYSERSAYSQGQRLLKNAEIQTRIVELGNVTAEELGLTKRRILTALWGVYEKAMTGAPKVDRHGFPIIVDGQMVMEWSPAGANKALELLMRHAGMLVESQKIELTVAQAESVLDAEIRRLADMLPDND